jgi:pyruvate-formate lyase-activating enzyme
MNDFSPRLVVSDGQGQVFDVPELGAVGVSGKSIRTIPGEDWILLPEGSQLMELPGRLPVGQDTATGEIIVLENEPGENNLAVAAFLAPAYTVCYLATWETLPKAPRLSLYAYAAVGWYDGQFYVPAIRIDPDVRQDPALVDYGLVRKAAEKLSTEYVKNRLAQHLIHNCALSYHCPAAINYLLNRWEMPLPTSRTCNSRCLGCISLQQGTGICSTQNRISFTPSAEEVIEIAVPHLETAPRPVVSFGQGCEGEPLMNPDLLETSIRGIRENTTKGTINLNTNASRPEIVERLALAGLDSMRISLNSARETYYSKYFRPIKYHFADVLKSIRMMKKHNRYVSLNYFVFPGFTDQPDEIAALQKLLMNYPVDLIQWRNLNIDPEWYWDELNPNETEGLGIRQMIEQVKTKFPALQHGYFNPYLNPE